MDLWIIAALAMLVVWSVATFALPAAPGWVHLFLTLGVFLLIGRIVVRGTPPYGKWTGGTRDDERGR
jgi:hypothetical protein